MNKIFILVSLIFFLFPGYLYPFQDAVVVKDGEINIRSECRRLFQGEVIKITLQSPEFSCAKAHFDGKDYAFVSTGDLSTSFLLIGLGLDIKPGVHDLNVQIKFTDDQRRDFPFKIHISKGEFPLKKIKIDRRFIYPPPEVQKRILREVELTRAVYKEIIPHWLGDGRFIVPVKGQIKRNFGERRVFNDEVHSRHKGIDISCPAGVPVKASNSGKIVLTRDLFFSGKTVIINHGLGLCSVYCHLSRICVEEGEPVKRGEIIGYAGSTGRATGPHLHWGFRLFDNYLDPFSVIYLSFD